MSKAPNSSPGPWEVVNEGDGEYRVRVKGSMRKEPGFCIERTVAEGFHHRKDAILAASAPDLALALRDMLDAFVELSDSGDAGDVLPPDSPMRLAAEALLKRVKA